MSNLILSIIIPSFNTVKFIEHTLPTFIDPRLEGKLEVLVISDGSTDGTVELARKYECKSSIIKVVEKENGGHGSVINMGIEIAKGKYIKVVDGDDTVITENLVKLIDDLEQSNADLVITQYNTIDISKNNLCLLRGVKDFPEKKELNIDNITESIGAGCIHSYHFLREKIKGKFLLTEKCFYDDFEYTSFPLPFIDTLMYLAYPVVNYYIGQKGQSVNIRNTYKNRIMHETILMDSIDFFNSITLPLSDSKWKYIYDELVRLSVSNYNIYIKNSDLKDSYIELKRFDDLLKKKSEKVYSLTRKKLYIRMVMKNIVAFNIIGFINRFK